MAGKFLSFDASFSSRFRLFLSSYGRLFVMFFTTQIADDTVTRAFSFESSQCAVDIFVFTYANR